MKTLADLSISSRIPSLTGLRLLLLLLMPLQIVSGCTATANKPAPPVEARQASTITSIQTASERWQQQTDNYEFVASQQCYCLPEARAPRIITVENGRITGIRLESSGEKDPKPPELLQKTITEWFDYLQQQGQSDTAKVSGTFDAGSGFPKRISVDLHPRMADDEFSIVFSGFNPS